MQKELTNKQQAFVIAIENSMNKTTFNNGVESAKFAGYKGNDRTLAAVASENLTKPNIIEARQAIKAEIQAKTDFDRTQSELELNLARERAIAKGDIPSEIAAIREKNTIFALRTENINTGNLADLPALTPAEQERYKLIAKNLSKPV